MKKIQKQLDDGIDYAAGKITVIQLLECYISIKHGERWHGHQDLAVCDGTFRCGCHAECLYPCEL